MDAVPAGSLQPKRGVLVLSGYGLRIAVERGHLLVSDGVGMDRRSGRLARATCGLKRLVVLGHAGTISLDALKWLADLGAAFVQVDHDGSLFTASTPVGTDNVHVRRAQALAPTTGTGLALAKELIAEKLVRQQALVARLDPNGLTAPEFARAASLLSSSATIADVRLAEAVGAAAYWAAWSTLAVRFAKRDVSKVPAHWHHFETRSSSIVNGPRLAVSPVNALLNYLYAMLEAEARIACLALGLDPGMGVLHADLRARDSLALDLMEPVRPRIDQLVLDLLERRVFSAKDFFETVQGNCRLMPSVTSPLAEHAPVIARWVAPYAELAARTFVRGDATGQPAFSVPTPLTQANRSAGRDGIRVGTRQEVRTPELPLPAACRGCGVILEDNRRSWCAECYAEHRSEKDRANVAIASAARAAQRAEGRDPSHGGEAAARRGGANRNHVRLNAEWEATNELTMTEEEFRERVGPLLTCFSARDLAQVMGVSVGYALMVKKGQKVPHPRHWEALAVFTGLSC